MIIKYTFVTGDSTEIEVSDEIGNIINESRRAENAASSRYRHHCYSYDAILYEGMEYADEETPENMFIANEMRTDNLRRLHQGLLSLTSTERRRLLLVSAGYSYRKIALLEGVSSHSKISKSVNAARKKMLSFLKIETIETIALVQRNG